MKSHNQLYGGYRVALLLLACGFAGAVPARALSPGADLQTAIDRLQRRYAAIVSLSADFRQTYRGPGMEQTESGVLYMKKPGLMRWEYRDPEIKLFIADGRDTYMYTPEDRQVLVRRFTSEDLHSTPLQFLFGQGDIRRIYEIAFEPGVDPTGADVVLRLTPRSPDADYAHAVIRCDAASFDMRGIVIHERSGNTSEFLLGNFKTNVKIDDSQFKFKAPRGVEVVRLDEK